MPFKETQRVGTNNDSCLFVLNATIKAMECKATEEMNKIVTTTDQWHKIVFIFRDKHYLGAEFIEQVLARKIALWIAEADDCALLYTTLKKAIAILDEVVVAVEA